jgi:putative transposase
MKEENKLKRKNGLLQTREKRKSQECKVFNLKIDSSHLSKEKELYLKRLFLEGKWYYNYILSSEDIFKFNEKQIKITVLNKDLEKEERDIKYLTAQMRADIKTRIISSIKGLSTKKKKGNNKQVGRLKFKSKCDSIPLRQHEVTYRFENNKYIFIQGFKKHFKILGSNQIESEFDFANARLIRKASGYYIQVTCFKTKIIKIKTNKSIGLDFGIKDSIVDSDGNKFNFQFPESKQIKIASKKFNKSNKGTVKRRKAYKELLIATEKHNNKKQDCKNKFVSKLIKENDLVVIQNENLKAWHSSKMKGFGRRIQHSIMGGIKSELRKHSETLVLDRFFPSTQLCPSCGNLNKHGLEKRTYHCDCGYFCDRDIHAARNILIQGLRIINREPINLLDEKKSSVIEEIKKFNNKKLFEDSGSQMPLGFGSSH